MRIPIRPLHDRWPAALERHCARFFWHDPRIILRDDAPPEQFRQAMSSLHVGETIKITGSNRHPLADALVVDHVELDGASLLDIGASDGSTSLDLVRRLPTFARYTIADKYLQVEVARVGRRDLFYGPDGDLILITGPRTLAWPARSRLVRTLYSAVLRRARRERARRRPVLLLNPEVRSLMAVDPRVTYRVHDIFEPWSGERPTLIKVANVLRRLYFNDQDIARALTALLDSLDQGGYLLVVDNPRIPGIEERCGLYRRDGDRFQAVEESSHRPEIRDLVLAARTDAVGPSGQEGERA